MNKISNINQSELTAICSNNTLTLTPNNRVAKNLRDRASNYKLSATNKKACITPNVKALSTWVNESFAELRSMNIAPFSKLAMINDQHQASYWVKELVNHDYASDFADPLDILSEALSADKFLDRWCIEKIDTSTITSKLFWDCRNKVSSAMNGNGFITFTTAIKLLINAIEMDLLILPRTVALFAFDEQPKLYKKLFEAIAKKSILREVNPIRAENTCMKYGAKDQREELSAMASWASRIVKEEPNKTIGIVSYELHNSETKKSIIKALDNVFEPQKALDSTDQRLSYDISMGDPLDSFYVIEQIMYYLLLGLIDGYKFQTEKAKWIIQDSLLGHAYTEKMERKKFTLEWRDKRSYLTSLQELAENAFCPPHFRNILVKLMDMYKGYSDKKTPSAWAMYFTDMLSAIGFCESAQLGTKSVEALNKWKDVLDTLSGLDVHMNMVDAKTCLNILKSMCNRVLVTPPDSTSPVSVLGALEASGLDYDYFWLIGCTPDVFPPPPKPNSCLPLNLQQDNLMPHSCAERQLAFSKQLLSRFKGSCSTLIASYVGQESLLFQQTPEVQNISLLLDDDIYDYDAIAYKQYAVTTKPDFVEPVIEGSLLKGGVSVIDNTSDCPIKALLINRLGINPFPVYNHNGFTSAERGDIKHAVLENVWRGIIQYCENNNISSHQSALISMDKPMLQKMILEAINMEIFLLGRNDIGDELLNSEISLLKTSINEVFEIDKSRQPFNIVSLEEKGMIEVGGYNLSIRIDRVDEVTICEDVHKSVVIDYKSSEHSISKAFSRNIASQLPLAALQKKTDGIAYLNVEKNNSKLVGVGDGLSDLISATNHKMRNLPKDWLALQEIAKENMEEQIKIYASGDLFYKPSSTACVYCPKSNSCQSSVA